MSHIRMKRYIAKMISFSFVFIIGTAALTEASDRLTNVGTTAASFLEVGIGSRAIGMGGAFVGVADDISALYWNPAGICKLSQPEFIFERVEWLADIDLNFIGTSIPLQNRGSIGFFINVLTVPKMLVRTVDFPDGTGEEFNVGSMAVGLTYSLPLTDRFSIGFTGKYISEKIWQESASTFALDIGTLYHTGYDGLRIGAMISNFGSPMKMTGSDLIIYYDSDPSIDGNNDRIMGTLMTDDWPLPLNMQFGIAWDIINNRKTRMTLAIDALHPINNTESINAGCEISMSEIIFLRFGYKAFGQQDSEEGFTLGTGIRYKMFGQSIIKFDYAFADFGRLNYVHRFTLRLDI